MALRVLLLLLAFSLSACSLGVQTSGCPAYGVASPPDGPLGPGDYVELQRGPCFGSCPVYSLRIYADGRVNWKGEQNVQVAGEQTAAVPVAGARAHREVPVFGLPEALRSIFAVGYGQGGDIDNGPPGKHAKIRVRLRRQRAEMAERS